MPTSLTDCCPLGNIKNLLEGQVIIGEIDRSSNDSSHDSFAQLEEKFKAFNAQVDIGK